MTKSIKPVLIAAGGLLLLFLLAGCGNKNELTIDKVEIMADLLPDGDLYVEELYTYTVRGEWNSFRRYMDNYGSSNIEFFEAYVPPSDRKLGQFGYEHLDRYPVALRVKQGAYRVDVPAKDESVSVYYRYRLDQQAVKYSDGGELDWTVLDYNDEDHRNITVTLRVRQPDAKPLAVYAYDRSGGSIVEETNGFIRYENKLLPEQDSVKLKVFVPAEALPDMEAAATSSSLSERVADEEAFQLRFAKREQLLEAGRQASLWLIYAVSAGVVF